MYNLCDIVLNTLNVTLTVNPHQFLNSVNKISRVINFQHFRDNNLKFNHNTHVFLLKQKSPIPMM